jgi:hypothetical protein
MRYIALIVAIGVIGGLAACGSSPSPSSSQRSTPPPVTLHGVFIDYYSANPTPNGSTCSDYESEVGSQLSVNVEGGFDAALTFANAPAGYESASVSSFGGPVWLCAGQWSVTVPSSGAGWVFTLETTNSTSSPSSSVTVPASDSRSSIALDSASSGLELADPAGVATALAAKPQPTLSAAQKAAAAAAARKAAAEKKAAAAKAAAARAARIAAENTPISSAQWGRVIRNPDNYIGNIYTISGTVAEYNLSSNTFATVENAAIVATDANGNDFVVECDASKLGNVQPGQTFTAKVTVVGVVQAQNTVYGGTGELPDFDASTFTVTG